MTWRIQLLGDFRLSGEGRDITRFESRKVVALLARIALEPGRLHAREELAAVLWPDADRRTGLERLRHVLSSLQRQLTGAVAGTSDSTAPLTAEPLLFVDRAGVRLNRAHVSCDAVEFEAQIRGHHYAEARALYAGDLLPGHYDDWIQDERERLRALYEEIELAGGDEPAQPAAASPPAAPLLPASPAWVPPSRTVFLPTYLTTFFGREAEREQLGALIPERRLVTILGPGGCGKTRIAVEIGRAIAPQFETVVFVPLAECVDPTQIPDRLRAALGLAAASGSIASPLEQVALALGDQSALLVLDNLEQMGAAGVGEAVEALLAYLPQTRCLVTSRTLLHLTGEQSFPLAPLPIAEESEGSIEYSVLRGGGDVPSSQYSTLNTQYSPHSPALALFVDRARAVRPDFTITPRNRDDVIALCRLLDGIPLALELAASRVRAHSIAEMRRQIEEEGRRFALIARPDVFARKDPRHGSLHAALAWSWRLLTGRQREFLASLSVLRGRWTAETAAAVSGASDALLLLEELEAASLVSVLPSEDGSTPTRFFLLETVRAFAAEQLSSERRYELHRANAAYVLACTRNPERAARLTVEDLTALEGTLEDSIADGAAVEALTLCSLFDEVWLRFGRADTAIALVLRALALTDNGATESASAALRAEVLEVASYLATVSLDLAQAATLAERALEVAGADSAARASACLALGRVAHVRGDAAPAVRALLEEAVTLAEQANLPHVEAGAWNLLGLSAGRTGDREAAEKHLLRAQRLWEKIGHTLRANHILYNRASIVSDSGAVSRAIGLYTESLRVASRMGDTNLEIQIHNNLGASHARLGHWKEALHELRACARRGYARGYVYSLAYGLWNAAEPLAYRGQGAAAATLMAFAARFWTNRGATLTESEIGYCDRIYAEAVRSLPGGTDDVLSCQARGEALSLSEAVALVLSDAETPTM